MHLTTLIILLSHTCTVKQREHSLFNQITNHLIITHYISDTTYWTGWGNCFHFFLLFKFIKLIEILEGIIVLIEGRID